MRAVKDATIQLTAAGEEVTRMEILQKANVASYLQFKPTLGVEDFDFAERKTELHDKLKKEAVELKAVKTKHEQCQLDQRNAEANVTRLHEQITNIDTQIATIANRAENVKT